MTGFEGFPDALFAFFGDLEDDNSRAFWQAHRPVWEQAVRDPMLALLAELEGEFPPLRMFRPHRDLRFSADKTPYKTWVGATSEAVAVGGTGYYVRVDATGLVVGFGAMAMARDQLRRFRDAVAEPGSGEDLAALVDRLAADGLPVTAGARPPLTRCPPGFEATHPRIDLLRWRGLAVVREHPRAPWLGTRAALDRIRRVWRGAAPLERWLADHVGAATQPVAVRTPAARSSSTPPPRSTR